MNLAKETHNLSGLKSSILLYIVVIFELPKAGFSDIHSSFIIMFADISPSHVNNMARDGPLPLFRGHNSGAVDKYTILCSHKQSMTVDISTKKVHKSLSISSFNHVTGRDRPNMYIYYIRGISINVQESDPSINSIWIDQDRSRGI